VFEILRKHNAPAVLLLAGKGNNGGDAFVAARHLAAAGCTATLVLLCRRTEIQDAALHHFQQLVGVTIQELAALDELLEIVRESAPAVVVDGLFGTGLKGDVREPSAGAIRFINSLGLPVVAADIPSGLDGDTGEVHGVCVRADVTVTMALPKIGLLQPAAVEYVGRIEIADLGFPEKFVEEIQTEIEMISRADVAALLPRRRRAANKGDFGHLLIIAGSEGFTGAPVICARAAARSGAGLVALAVPREIYPIVAGLCPPEVMPLPWDKLESFDKFDAVAIGPGLGRGPAAVQQVANCLANCPVPLVVDADALNILAADTALWGKLGSSLVLTPHPGEMGRLIGKSAKEVQAHRWEIARAFVEEHNVTLALKGAGTVVTEKSGKLWINSTGNPGMAKGGMGDALTGIIGALLGQGLAPLDATRAGVFLHGLAGDLAAQKVGETALMVTDLIESLGAAFERTLSHD
jgi:NAD(P)H-hydrate epimerase